MNINLDPVSLNYAGVRFLLWKNEAHDQNTHSVVQIEIHISDVWCIYVSKLRYLCMAKMVFRILFLKKL